MSETLQSLRCAACSRQRLVGYSEQLVMLRSLGKLKRAKNPELDLVRELFAAALPALPCDRCGATSLSLHAAAAVDEEDPEVWGEARRCELCQKPIPPERLEIFPDVVRCAACQDKPAAETEDDFCPRCGERLQVAVRSRGLTQYRLRCPRCG
ncbi:TraR/DksA C4-type zinc finger protein [Roseimaritima ulvae]|uniref:Prokaryotic dksA/traR C4-type zinc finger n=1 Tax=Roseimaritima ulvae TaxID=980254 RepID=A0A5B9QVE5_9BACT|nr:TraR/DksA C4-type zinc finger protein [Roseimaritima ulvae]QEG41780.1 Prokaryotic dksA/traR C4-type zinc finger [Roseimaritima ulvae]